MGQPLIASAALVLDNGLTLGYVRGDVISILDSEAASVKRVSNLILDGKSFYSRDEALPVT